jgi:hypothetical protein
MVHTANIVQLKAETLHAFDAYIRDKEKEMDTTLKGSGVFLWSDASPARAQPLCQGSIVAEFWSGQSPVKVPSGLIHDWIGAAFVPDATVHETLALVQDYDHHKDIYQPEVMDSKLVSHHGNDFKIQLRLLKKKVITVVLDTDHDVHYLCVDRMRWFCRSHTTRIAEVEDAGTQKESVLSPDTGHGFLWRLYSYWRFQEKKGGVWIECRAISLTRDIPFGLGWILEPIVQTLPRESLINTLEATRRALTQ